MIINLSYLILLFYLITQYPARYDVNVKKLIIFYKIFTQMMMKLNKLKSNWINLHLNFKYMQIHPKNIKKYNILYQ